MILVNHINFFLFGYTGNLAKIKILPVIAKIPNVRVIGIGRRPVDYPFYIQKDIEVDGEQIIEEIKKYQGDKIFYLATYPSLYPKILTLLKEFNDSKVMIEKPIAKDLKFDFDEKQIYRVDHYLGKSGLRDLQKKQNKDVDHIEVYILENFGVGERSGFYDSVGALYDIGQNHILQMIAATFGASGSIEREGIISDLVPDVDSLILGTYEGYEKTDTYFSFSASYKNISIKVFAGKNLNENKKEVVVYFKDGSKKVYPMDVTSERGEYENLISEAIDGDKTYFNSDGEIKASWKFVDALHKEIKVPIVYKVGSSIEEII